MRFGMNNVIHSLLSMHVFSGRMEKPHAVWLDNFSHAYAAQMQGCADGAYKACLWTGEAWHMFRPSRASQDLGLQSWDDALCFQKDSNGDQIDALPSVLLNNKNVRWLKLLLSKIDNNGVDFFDDSVATIYNVTRIPLKVCPKKARAMGKIKLSKVLKESRDGLIDLFPRRLVPINIGSTRGLLTILKQWEKERQEQAQRKYSILCVDTNIFRRTLKVLDCELV